MIVAVEKKVYLCRLFPGEMITVGATDSEETFEDSGVFFHVYRGSWLSMSGKPTTPANVAVYQLVEDGKFIEMFESLGGNRRRWESEKQIGSFCQKNPDRLVGGSFGNFFELPRGFVARVHKNDSYGYLTVVIDHFVHGHIWRALSGHQVLELVS